MVVAAVLAPNANAGFVVDVLPNWNAGAGAASVFVSPNLNAVANPGAAGAAVAAAVGAAPNENAGAAGAAAAGVAVVTAVPNVGMAAAGCAGCPNEIFEDV